MWTPGACLAFVDLSPYFDVSGVVRLFPPKAQRIKQYGLMGKRKNQHKDRLNMEGKKDLVSSG